MRRLGELAKFACVKLKIFRDVTRAVVKVLRILKRWLKIARSRTRPTMIKVFYSTRRLCAREKLPNGVVFSLVPFISPPSLSRFPATVLT